MYVLKVGRREREKKKNLKVFYHPAGLVGGRSLVSLHRTTSSKTAKMQQPTTLCLI